MPFQQTHPFPLVLLFAGTEQADSVQLSVYRFSISIWIIMGLAWFATFISGIQEFLQAKLNEKTDTDKSSRLDKESQVVENESLETEKKDSEERDINSLKTKEN